MTTTLAIPSIFARDELQYAQRGEGLRAGGLGA